MQISSYEEYTDGHKLNIDISDFLPKLIHSLGRFLKYLADTYPFKMDEFVTRLEKKISSEIDKSSYQKNIVFLDTEKEKYEYLKCYPRLYDYHFEYVLNILKLNSFDFNNHELIEIDSDDFYLARYVPGYLRLCVLADVIGRQQAISVMKGFIDMTISQIKLPELRPQSITELREKQLVANINGQDMHWTTVVLNEHEYLNKVTKCRIHEVLKQYEDKELMEIIACYQDFSMFKAINSNFILTRTQTLIGGYPYCDTCYHDSRYINSICHPEHDVFENVVI